MSTRTLTLFAMIAVAANVVAVLVVHLLRSEYDPWVQFVSEYAVGPYSWIAKAGNVFAVGGIVALFSALLSEGVVHARSVAFVSVCAHVAMRVLVWVFPVDPLEPAFADGGVPEFTATGWIHVIAGVIAAVTMMLAALLVTVHLWRMGRVSGAYWLLAVGCVLAPVWWVITLVTPPATFPAGLYQRLFMTCLWLWMFVACAGLLSGQFSMREKIEAWAAH